MRLGLHRPITASVLLPLALACSEPSSSERSGPAQTEIDATRFGEPGAILTWTPDQQLAGYQSMDRIYPTREIHAGEEVLPLPDNLRDLSGVTFQFEDESYDLDSFVEHNHIAGLLVLKGGEIVLERYEDGNTAETKWVSFSIAKSVVSLLIGAAVQDGYIPNLDVSVTEYLPLLDGSAYEDVTIRQAMQMASGVQWNEDYGDPDSDVSRAALLTTLAKLQYLGGQPRTAVPGERFNYNSGETHLVGAVLRSAIGNNLSTYLTSQIWGPFGMESDANWMLLEPDGAENGGCCISATLRDYGRIGLFAMSGGVLRNGERVLPSNWMVESTTPSAGNDDYGYLWWLRGGGAFAGLGIFGQMIWVDPTEDMVVVTHSAWPEATLFFGQGYAFARALREALRD